MNFSRFVSDMTVPKDAGLQALGLRFEAVIGPL